MKELDGVPYVGPATFAKLLDYAHANGFVTANPFETPCEGSPITLEELQGLSANGTAKLPSGATWTRTRTCNGALGCGPWSKPIKLGMPVDTTTSVMAIGADIHIQTEFRHSRPLPTSLEEETRYRWDFDVELTPTGGARDLIGWYHYVYGATTGVSRRLEDASATFTSSCLSLTGRHRIGSPMTTETEVMQLTTFE